VICFPCFRICKGCIDTIQAMVIDTRGKLLRFLLHDKLLVITAPVKLRMATSEFL